MPEVRFEGIMQSLYRLPEVVRSIPDIVANPAANPLQAALLLAIVLTLILVVLMSVLLVVVRPSRADREMLGIAPVLPAAAEKKFRWGWVTIVALVVLVVALLWVVTGITSGARDVCTSCHIDTPHSKALSGTDPHAAVPCVSCHETGGPVARTTVNLPIRFEHMVVGRFNAVAARSYGRPIASDSCMRCHAADIKGVIVIKKTGLRMEHEQPLKAGAQCADCHTLNAGVVSLSTAGMTPCLRCHNGTIARADCKVCHIGNPTDAIVATRPGSMAAVQVPNPQCSSCHTDMTSCNACHGIEMPHSILFKAYGHARPAAINIWFGNGKQCDKCHYKDHRPCLNAPCHVHSSPIAGGHPNPIWAVDHTRTGWDKAWMTACACHQWNPYDHDGMKYCQICHPVKPKGANP